MERMIDLINKYYRQGKFVWQERRSAIDLFHSELVRSDESELVTTWKYGGNDAEMIAKHYRTTEEIFVNFSESSLPAPCCHIPPILTSFYHHFPQFYAQHGDIITKVIEEMGMEMLAQIAAFDDDDDDFGLFS